MNKTQRRVDWLNKHREEIIKSRAELIVPPRHKGHNAHGIEGMSSPG